MIKTTVNKKSEDAGFGFPKLMENKDYGRIILFSEPNVGVVVEAGIGDNIVGKHSSNWCMSYYSDLPEDDTLTLVNTHE